MITLPLAYAEEIPRHLAPTMGQGAPLSGDTFWTGTHFLPRECSQAGSPDGICADDLRGVEAACTASSLADFLDGVDLIDEHAPDVGLASTKSCLVNLFEKLHITDEPTSDLKSIGYTNPPVEMVIDSNAADVDAYPDHVEIIDDPLPLAAGITSASTVTEVLVISQDGASAGADQDPILLTLRVLTIPVEDSADGATREAHRLSCIDSAKQLAAMKRLADAY